MIVVYTRPKIGNNKPPLFDEFADNLCFLIADGLCPGEDEHTVPIGIKLAQPQHTIRHIGKLKAKISDGFVPGLMGFFVVPESGAFVEFVGKSRRIGIENADPVVLHTGS